MNLFHLRYFVKLAHEQHYTRAAEKLCITQPSLSNAMAQLEKELGIRLFKKTDGASVLLSTGSSSSNALWPHWPHWIPEWNLFVWRRRGTD